MLELTLTQDIGGQWIHIQGRIDSLTSPEIRQKIEDLVLQGQRTIVVDLEKVTYVSSAGLRVFMESQIKLKHVSGEIILLNPAPNILELMHMSCFEQVFRISTTRADVESYLNVDSTPPTMQSTIIDGIAFSYVSGETSPGKVFSIGSQEKMANSSYEEDDAVTVSANRISYGTGLASLGGTYEECKSFFGEAMIIHRNFFFYPAVKRPAVDYMLSSQDESNILYQFLHGFGFNGEFSHRIAFEGTEGLIELPTLIDTLFKISEANLLGVVFLAESKGFWGMHLKQVPLSENRPANAKSIFDTANFTHWINFPIEPSDINHIIAGVGIAVRDKNRVSPPIRELIAKDAQFHLHAGVFTKDPLTKKPERFDDELKRVLTNLEVSKVQHVLGQTKFGNGLIGIIPLESE